MAFASACEPLRAANHLAEQELFRWLLISTNGQPVASSSNMLSIVQYDFMNTPKLDMLLIMASYQPEDAVDTTLLNWLKRQAAKGVLMGGVDTGPYALAKAGLLNNYRATVHWEYLDAFSQAFPRVQVKQAMYITDRKRCTAAGGTACLDMMLDLICQQHGQVLAAAVADQFVYGRMRQGSEQQRLDLAQRLPPVPSTVLQAINLMEQHVEDTLSTAQLAAAVGVSLRSLERLFRRWLKTTPGAYYQDLRLLQARSLLQQSGLSVTEIAHQCGFNTLAGFSRAYKNRFGQAPSRERLH